MYNRKWDYLLRFSLNNSLIQSKNLIGWKFLRKWSKFKKLHKLANLKRNDKGLSGISGIMIYAVGIQIVMLKGLAV